jgi:hypothetical protein
MPSREMIANTVKAQKQTKRNPDLETDLEKIIPDPGSSGSKINLK